MTSNEPHNPIYVESPADSSSELVPMVMRLLRIFRHRRKIIVATLYCFGLAGTAYFLLAPRYYQSSAKLLIVEQKLDQLSAVGDHDSTGNTMATHRELVTSPIVIQHAIERLQPRHRIDLQGKSPRKWTETIAMRLSARITRRTNFIDVTYRSRDPETAAMVVRAVIESYLEFVDKNHKGTAGDIVTVLTDERNRLQENLNSKQSELQQFRQSVGHLAISPNDGVVEPMIQRATRLNEALLEAQEKRVGLQATLASVEDSLQRGEDVTQQLMTIESTLGRQMLLASMGLSPQDMQMLSEQQNKMLTAQAEMQSLAADYGPNHPRIAELQQQIQSHQQFLRTYHSGAGQRLDSLGDSIPGEVVVNMLGQSVRQAQQKEKQLDEAFELARAEAAKNSDALVQLRTLERDVARKESLYDSLSEKIATIDISQVQAPIKATVVREPLSDDLPVSPRLRFVAIACFVGGGLVGGLIAYVQDILDDRFNSPEELSSQLGVPMLAMVRKLESLPGEGMATVHTHAMPNAVETEAFRTLRTALSFGGDVCDRILVSSSEPGDGKTTISANLAVAFAQADKRTLVIDADLRRPGFTALVDLKGQPGVADVLSSDLPPAETAPPLICHTEVEGLDILPVGLRRPNPAELLSGKGFVELMAWADSQYDRVIVDCPPVLAVSDAQIVGQLVDGAILVVRPEKNHRRSVMRAVESFHASGCRVLGVVANDLSSDSGGYGYGYGYGYGDGYGNGDGYGQTTDTANTSMLSMPISREEEFESSPPQPPIAAPQTTIRPRRAA